LRTPLTSLLGYLETLSLKGRHVTPEESSSICHRLRQGNKVRHIFRSSCLSWRGWNTAASNRSASPSRWRSFSDVAQKFDLMAARAIRLLLECPGTCRWLTPICR
jgi:K+-sensing histidine kinase KdpD